MPRITSAFGAVLALFLPLGRPLLLGVTPVIGIGAALLSMQKAHAQSAAEWLDSGNNKSRRGNYQDGIADYAKWQKALTDAWGVRRFAKYSGAGGGVYA